MRIKTHMIAIMAATMPFFQQAWAINKCTDANGQITYQEHPCTNEAASAQVINAAPSMDTGIDAATAQGRLSKIQNDNAKFDAMISGKVMRGMTVAQVHNAWGKPTRINSTVTSSGVREQWVYDSGKSGKQYLYVEDGVVTTIQSP